MVALPDLARDINLNCARCRTCQKECLFLQKYGLPGDIARSILNQKDGVNPFECSLCQLCAVVCPEKINPSLFFLALRIRAVSADPKILKKYKRLLIYERLGSSPFFSWYGLPQGSRSVFFPGCSISGTRPEATLEIFQKLKKLIPELGVALDCCSKPSHDLGNMTRFKDNFQGVVDRLKDKGVEKVILTCPSCLVVFQNYAPELRAKTAWELLDASNARDGMDSTVRVHDSCATRFVPEVHVQARELIRRLGLKIREMSNAGVKTLCCGEGGSVGFVNQKLAENWAKTRKDQAGNDPVVVYCAGCDGFLGRTGIKTIHLAELVLDPVRSLNKGVKPARWPRTYWNRIRLKRRFERLAAENGWN